MGVMPMFTVVFLIATLSSVALPLTSGFTGELLLLLGSFQTSPVAAAFATTAAIWSVVYMLWMFQRVMYGKLDNDANRSLPDMTSGEKWALIPLVLLIFLLGVYPTPTVLNKVNPAVTTVLAQTDQPYNNPFDMPDVVRLRAVGMDSPRFSSSTGPSAVSGSPKGPKP